MTQAARHAEMSERIHAAFNEVLLESRPHKALTVLADDSVLLETGLDSLGFAILVKQLEEKLGFDPFTLSSEDYYPRTYGEFVDFYTRHDPSAAASA